MLFFVAALMLVTAWNLDFPEERLHLIEYGGAGWLCAWVFSRRSDGWAKALVLVYLLGLCDEIIQYIIPCRVYDDRDVILNFASGAAGVAIFKLCSSGFVAEGRLTANDD